MHSSPLRWFLPATYHESRSPVTAPVDVTDISHHANEQPSEITSTRAKLTDPSDIILSCQSDNYSSTCTLCGTIFILQSPDGSGVPPKLVQVLVYHTGATCCLPPTCLMLRTIRLVNKWGSFPNDHCSPSENSVGHSASSDSSLVSQPRSTEPFKPTGHQQTQGDGASLDRARGWKTEKWALGVIQKRDFQGTLMNYPPLSGGAL